MLTNSFISIITITKTITIITNISNSTLNIIIIKSLIERSKRLIKEVTKLKDVKDNHKKSIS